jgi:nicotinate-nucleotide--dimethylbenzimidazole phosphoribosyltransferase
VRAALTLHCPDSADALDVLSAVGGFEIGGLAGVILGAAASRCPVIVDGFITGAAALLATTLCPAAREFLLPSHCSVEPGHQVAMAKLGLAPLFDLQMRLGEGTGALLAVNVVRAAVAALNEMATFDEAAVSGPSE